jgi:hypothetical protein
VTVAIAIAICLALIGTILNLRDWYAARQRLMAECAHRWIYISAWNEGRYWNRVCRHCPKQEPVALENVPEEWRQRVSDDVTARVRSRRHLWRRQASVARRHSRLTRKRSRSAR